MLIRREGWNRSRTESRKVKNKGLWKPTKFELSGGRLKASKNPKYLAVGSRLITDIVAKTYQEAICKHAKGLLVDLGCGQVPLYGYYKDYVSDVICIDWEGRGSENPYLDYIADLNRNIPLPADYCDTLLATDVLEHISNPDLLWKEMARILKNKGRLILASPFLYPLHEEPFDYCRYTEHKLRMFCENNGFTVIELRPYGGTPEVIFSLIAIHLNICKSLAACYVFLCNLFLKIPLCKYISAKTDKKFPLGYILVAEQSSK
jgi:SAM-dependent methyltransferase